jgi:hypothetical protein
VGYRLIRISIWNPSRKEPLESTDMHILHGGANFLRASKVPVIKKASSFFKLEAF